MSDGLPLRYNNYHINVGLHSAQHVMVNPRAIWLEISIYFAFSTSKWYQYGYVKCCSNITDLNLFVSYHNDHGRYAFVQTMRL